MNSWRYIVLALAAAWLAPAAASAANATTVVLRGGAAITAPVLKRDGRVVALDLGYDVLTVPADLIVEIREARDAADAAPAVVSDFYTVGAPAVDSIAEAAALFAPAVVVVRTPRGLGSGFFVNRAGYLITNFHVIRGERQAAVTRFVREGGELRRIVYQNARIVAVDAFHDLAVLRIEPAESDPPIEPVRLAPGDANVLGEPVFVIGNPLGLERSVTQGVVSQTARNFNGLLFLQTDAPVNPGNSGGPLFNSRGQVIGIINMQIPIMQGLNFAIPARKARFLLDHLDDYAFDETNAESGFLYPAPPRRVRGGPLATNPEKPQ